MKMEIGAWAFIYVTKRRWVVSFVSEVVGWFLLATEPGTFSVIQDPKSRLRDALSTLRSGFTPEAWS